MKSGWPISALGLGVLHLLNAHTSIVKWIFLNLVPGIGLGILYPSVMLAVQAAASRQYLSISVTTTSFFRALGQAVGVTIGGVVFQTASSPSSMATLNLGARRRTLPIVWAVMCGTAVLGILSSLLSWAYTLNQAFNTDQGIQTQKPDTADVDVAIATSDSEPRPHSRVSDVTTLVEMPRGVKVF
ncbi:hypothetical protein PENANT_c005G07246 [Penicillium antarcticum]|uniref:Major facilitator superfamily (MFS) profile domain-containing protein n=1 Tax=Penicillium antarcticum TaxID=416450 RepID=A0A1V6QEW2_9EURO|nr:hypothetical protein PENANT_c005G07246 [Penicillium antarcticum]